MALMQVGVSQSRRDVYRADGGCKGLLEELNDKLCNSYDRATLKMVFGLFCSFLISLIAKVHVLPIHKRSSEYTEFSVL